MKHSPAPAHSLRLWLALGLPLVCTTYVDAQQAPADTLRRSLKVMTSQQTRLEVRRPLGFELPAPKVYTAEPARFQPVVLRDDASPKGLSPLGALPPLPRLYSKSSQLGYVSAALGLKAQARLNAGLSPLHTDRERLDLNLSGHWSDYQEVGELLPHTMRDRGLGVSAEYSRQGKHSMLDVWANYRTDLLRRYGLIKDQLTRTLTELEIAHWDGLRRQLQSLHHLELGLELSSLGHESRRWHYHLAPRFTYTAHSPLTEISLGVDLGFKHKLPEYGHLLLDLRTQAAAYKGVDLLDGGALSRSSNIGNNNSYLQISPSWLIEGIGHTTRWGTQLGIGFTAIRTERQEQIPLLLWPKIDAYLSWGKGWRLRAEVDGGVSTNTLAERYRRNMALVLHSTQAPQFTRIPLRTHLGLTGLLKPNCAIELFAGYERLRGVEDYLLNIGTYVYGQFPTHQESEYYIVDGYMPLYRDTAPTHHYQIGGSVAYTFYRTYTFKVGLKGHRWQIEDGFMLPDHTLLHYPLSARPKLELETEVQYRPNDRLSLTVGYEVLSGIGYRFALNQPTRYQTMYRELPALSFFRLAGAYRVADRWTVTLDGHYAPGSNPSRVLGYMVQPFGLNIGFGYTF